MIGKIISHYRIEAELGRGGMGVVYRARDEQLDRDVALKILPNSALADETARKRFRKEALALAKLSHPNIGVVHEFSTQNGVDFLVMEYIPGVTLSEKLAAGSLPEKEVAALGGQIAAALEEAHEQGVVHRDLKPGNILVTPKGQAKVLDFGLAKLLQRVGDASATESFTDTQATAGTLPYMTPEQLRGEAAAARADIFALGNVLYEMAAGQRAFRETLASRLIDAILHQAPLAPRAVNVRISPELERIILKCLEKDPESRYQSAREIAVDLRRLAMSSSVTAAAAPPRPAWRRAAQPAAYAAAGVLLLAALLVGLNVGGWRERLLGRDASPRIESLAVLPLENLSGDPEQEYFADGMTEALITELAQIGALKVISRTSVMQYKGTKNSLPQIARELNVDAVVEGSVQRSGDQVGITVQLIHAPGDRHLWARPYQRPYATCSKWSVRLPEPLPAKSVKLTRQQEFRLSAGGQVNPEVLELYLRGRYLWNQRTPDSIRQAVKYFDQAIQRDPTYAHAYAGLADCYNLLGSYGVIPMKESHPKARSFAMKALELDENLAEAHTSLGAILADYYWDWPEVDKHFRRAIQVSPSYATAHFWYTEYLADMGRFQEAIEEAKHARDLDPLSPLAHAALGATLYKARQYDLAIEELRKTLERFPNSGGPHLYLGLAYVQKGMHEQALTTFAQGRARARAMLDLAALHAYAHAVAGQRDEALKILDKLKRLSQQKYVPPFTSPPSTLASMRKSWRCNG